MRKIKIKEKELYNYTNTNVNSYNISLFPVQGSKSSLRVTNDQVLSVLFIALTWIIKNCILLPMIIFCAGFVFNIGHWTGEFGDVLRHRGWVT